MIGVKTVLRNFRSSTAATSATRLFSKDLRNSDPAILSYSTFSRRACASIRSKNVNVVFASSLSFYSKHSGPQDVQKAQASNEFERDIGSIPDAPLIPPAESIAEVRKVIEDNLHELGLASYFTPVGWIQNLLGFLHSYTGLPWWEVIVLGTLLVRTITLPIIVSSQRRSATMLKHQPEMQRLGMQLEEAKRSGDKMKMQIAMLELNHFMREKHLPLMVQMLTPMFANGAIFASYFLSLRGMAFKSLSSMRDEGFLWFTDLTVPDPTLILPTMCAISTMLVIEVGIEFGVGANQVQPAVRWLMRIAPLTVLLFASQIPAAVMCYWFTSNIISLILALLFRLESVRRMLKIPALPPRQKTSLRESWRLPDFVRDYLSAPVLFARAANARFRKSRAKDPGSTASEKASDRKSP